MASRFYVPEVRQGSRTVELPSADAHHVRHVLRLGVGEPLFVFDGRGHEWAARVAEAGRARVVVELTHVVTPLPEPSVDVTLGIGVLKGDHMDAVIRDA